MKAKAHSKTFPTRADTEQHIAARDLAGKQKAQHVGGRWYLVVNRDGTVNRSLFSAMMRVELRRLARREQWPAAQLMRKLADVPAESERIWRETISKGKKK